LRQEILALPRLDEPVIIDEIQKLPIILDEVQALIDQGVRFVLTGSSARKLKTGNINLLGGRARLRNLHPFVSAELADFTLNRAIERGLLPSIWHSDEPEEDLRAYCGLYLKEEILAESIVRRLEGFSRFLTIAGMSNGREMNFENIAIVRPSMLLGERNERRPGEMVGKVVMKTFSPLLAGKLKKYRAIHGRDVARAMISVLNNEPAKNIYESDELQRIANRYV